MEDIVEVMGMEYQRYYPLVGWSRNTFGMDPDSTNWVLPDGWKWKNEETIKGKWEYAFSFSGEFESQDSIGMFARRRSVRRFRSKPSDVELEVKSPTSVSSVTTPSNDTAKLMWMKFAYQLALADAQKTIQARETEVKEIRKLLVCSNERANSAFAVARNSMCSPRMPSSSGASVDEKEEELLDSSSNPASDDCSCSSIGGFETSSVDSRVRNRVNVVRELNKQFSNGEVDIDQYALALSGIVDDDSLHQECDNNHDFLFEDTMLHEHEIDESL